MRLSVFFVSALISFSAFGSPFPKVDADLKAYDAHVTAMNEAFDMVPVNMQDKDWVKQKLQHMVDVDQYMRRYGDIVYDHQYTSDETSEFWSEFSSRWHSVDTANTTDLKALLKIYIWFKISDFGKAADNNAWLLVQHADLDPGFQRDILTVLEGLIELKETSPSNYAYLFDRVAASWSDPTKRQLQRYGTQGSCTGPGTWAPIPTEDPSNLDKRRSEVGLGPEAEYIAVFKDICR